MTKLYGASMGQNCSIWPGCFCVLFAAPWVVVATRYGLRRGPGNICGDFVCCYLLAPLAVCQVLRAANVSDWWLMPTTIEVCAPTLKFIR
jgi:hypothetical protein